MEQCPLVDVHAHFCSLQKYMQTTINVEWPTVFSCHGNTEISLLESMSGKYIFRSVGIHPQDPNIQLLSGVENALKTGKFCALGEVGIDLYPPYKDTLTIQRAILVTQLELAISYDLPVILHVRRGLAEIFPLAALFRRCKAVIFHSYSGTLTEAQALLKKMNAYFSFGTPVLWGAKQANLCLQKLPLEQIFLETDAPWQPQRGQDFTNLGQIQELYTYLSQVRGIATDDLRVQIFGQFESIFDKK